MHRYSEVQHLPYSASQLFDLVRDIESYPAFLPWCRAARIVAQEPSGFLGELIIHFSHLTERYTSRITPTPPTSDHPGSIEVALVSGPFKHLKNHWQFEHHPQGCTIRLALEFEFKSKLLDKLIGSMFERACAKMVAAFTARAAALYGAKAGA